jgi:DNA polymerase-1
LDLFGFIFIFFKSNQRLKDSLKIVKNMKKIALIDGYGFVFRSYHSMPPLSNPEGTPVGAVFGFTNMIIKLIASLEVTHIAVVFDSGSKTFRNDIYPKYKANRPECPEDLKPQFPIIREAAEALNLKILEKNNFEADDIIATIASKYKSSENKILIISSDKDLMQLVDENVMMYDAMKNKLIGEEEVIEKFQVRPNQVLDLLSLIGDASDNIPGIKGIGVKTASELLNQFDNLDNIFANLDKIKQEKRRNMLQDGIENAKLSKVLASLCDQVELEITIEDLERKNIDPIILINFLSKHGFNSTLQKVKKEFSISDEIINQSSAIIKKSNNSQNFNQIVDGEKNNFFADKELVKKNSVKDVKKTYLKNKNDLAIAKEKINQNSLTFFDIISSNSLENIDDFITFSSINNQNIEEIFYCKIAEKDNKEQVFQESLFATKDQNKDGDQIFLSDFFEIFSKSAIKKVFLNSKKIHKICDLTSYQDLTLMNHLVNSDVNFDLEKIIKNNFDDQIEDKNFYQLIENYQKNKPIFLDDDFEKKADFFCQINYFLSEFFLILEQNIFEKKLNFCYHSLELPLLKAVGEIEKNGIKIDIVKIKNLSVEFEEKIKKLTAEIYQIADCEFNIASTQQLAKIMFEKLNLSPIKKSKKTKAFSTNQDVLEAMSNDGIEIADKVLEFRKLTKLKNTYADVLPKLINEKTSKIHSTFSTTSTITGRFSSANPNLQNIPIKTIEGKKIRNCFIAEKNNLLISADYSQIELRVLAHLAKIENLIIAFKEGKDIHAITAAEVFKISENQVSKENREKAKAINFGIIYGISSFGLAKQLKISKSEAANYIDSYFKTYPGIENFMKESINSAKKNGFVQTISGRKCFIPTINDKNFMIKSEAERLAINASVQGSAADIIKFAILAIDRSFKKNNLSAKIILQIHDELVIESKIEEVELAKKIIKNEMENALKIDVPLLVDIETSTNL